MPGQPAYAASKAGLVQFVRSLGPGLWQDRGLKLVAICPQFVDTPMVAALRAARPKQAEELLASVGGRLIDTGTVVREVMRAAEAPASAPHVLLILADGTVSPFPRPRGRADRGGGAGVGRQQAAAGGGPLEQWAAAPLPPRMRSVKVHALSTDFRAATSIVSEPMPDPASLPRGSVLIRRLFTGLDASDMNFTSGRYFGSDEEAKRQIPFTAGFESVGAVVCTGPGVARVSPGQPVATVTYGGFSDFAVVDERHAIPVPEASPEVVAMLTSGLTASIALEQVGNLSSGETVLVTAAAGGTGQFAVQLAKLAGNRVVGTCGGAAKAALLAELGIDRVIDHTRESVKEVLKREYPKGVDLVYESVGGELFRTCVGALAPHGRLVVIGMMSQYSAGWPASAHPGLCEALLSKSASCRGFFLPHFSRHFRSHLERLVQLHRSGGLRVAIDESAFRGLEQVADAVDHLQSGKSRGKVVVRVAADAPRIGRGGSVTSRL